MPKSEPIDIVLVNAMIMMHTAKTMPAHIGMITKNTPRLVATPLPPRNFKNTGQMCPSTAAKPPIYAPYSPWTPTGAAAAKYSMMPPQMSSPISVLITPLATSPINVNAPTPHP